MGTGFTTPTAIAFLPGGRMLVAEKSGRVYTLVNGVKSANPLFSRPNEVLDVNDRGLLGMAVDPNYVSNKFLYFLYTVDPDSNGNDNNNDAFGRLVRYRLSATDSNTVDYSTRTILMGVSWRYGPFSGSPSHTIGSLRFGTDGTLLVSTGDGASFTQVDAGGLDGNVFGSGANKTDPYEDIGAFRAQSLTSLCGKILRINPSNGQGYSSNPYWNGDATSIRSRVWAYGLRNPFRINIRPGSGSTNPSSGDPGTVYIGDVGMATWEEMNVVRTPGRNFGWPCYEGINQHNGYQNANPAHNDCDSFGQSDNPAGQTSPASTWHHSNASSSVPPGVVGNASVGGVFYTGTRYPANYRGAYFFADYGTSWLRVATFDSNDQLQSISGFGLDMDEPVDFATDPVSGDIFYVSIGAGEVRRIRYTGGSTNADPLAVANASPTAGVAPLTVNFSSAGSIDPDDDPLGFAWNFGDGTSSSAANPTHTYLNSGLYDAELTVNDGQGGVDHANVAIIVGDDSDFPSTPVRDNFNRANGAIGGSWVDETTTLRIASNALTQLSGSATTVWNGGTFGPNQEAYVTFAAVTPSAPEHNLMLKVQGTSWSAGHVEVRYDATASEIAVSTYDPSTAWITHGTIEGVSFGPGDQFGARALGNGTVQVFKSGILLGSVSVAGWPSAGLGGRIGMTLTGATSSRLDDFGGGTMQIAANTPPTASILLPIDHSFFAEGETISLDGSGSDAEDAPAALAYHWQVDLHHNNHVHPGSHSSDLEDDSIIGENHEDGTGVFLRVHLMVTDTGGLKDTTHVDIYPEIELYPTFLGTVPSPLVAGAPALYEFTLVNQGRMPSSLVHWTLRTELGVAAEGDTLVPPQSDVRVSRPVTAPSVSGAYTLRAVVDSLDRVVETNEFNNVDTKVIQVISSPLVVEDAPRTLELSTPRPNPSLGPTRIALSLPKRANVTFAVYDLQGRSLWRAPARSLDAGRWDLTWPGVAADGKRARPGVYLATIGVGGRKLVRRIAIAR